MAVPEKKGGRQRSIRSRSMRPSWKCSAYVIRLALAYVVTHPQWPPPWCAHGSRRNRGAGIFLELATKSIEGALCATEPGRDFRSYRRQSVGEACRRSQRPDRKAKTYTVARRGKGDAHSDAGGGGGLVERRRSPKMNFLDHREGVPEGLGEKRAEEKQRALWSIRFR